MTLTQTSRKLDELRKAVTPLTGGAGDYDELLELCRDRSFILLGEASHGTHEFYRARAEITKRLILEQGLNAVAVEADWPSAYRVNRYVRGLGNDRSAEEALGEFQRFPLWMWRNMEMLEFVEWLRDYNHGRSPDTQVGFYGLDMYSLYESIHCVLEYLDKVDPEAADAARASYGCLNHSTDEQAYGYGVMLGRRPSCENEVVRELMNLRDKAMEYVLKGGMMPEDEHFQAEQNARLIRDAERYYRTLFTGGVNSWNLRDRHMSDTLEALSSYLKQVHGLDGRIAVWEHNSHVGDARATDMGRRGDFNVGQLTRERYGNRAILVGFTTYTGTVSAASSWGNRVERKAVRPGMSGSYEALFHEVGEPAFFLKLDEKLPDIVRQTRLERAIGVLYLPASERQSHYFNCYLADQFDAVIHFDTSRALEPLDHVSEWSAGAPDTYPFGL